MTTSNRFSVLARENTSNFQPPSLSIDLEEQSCTRKKTTSLRENTATPSNDNRSDKPNKDLLKRNSNSSRKISSEKKMKDKKFRKSRDVTVILGDCIIKDAKGWELTDDSNNVIVKSFRGSTTSQMKWHVKPTTEQNPKNIILNYGTNDINDESDPQNVAEEIVELAKSISTVCNSNVTVSDIVPKYGKLNEKVRSFNHLLRIYCRNMNMRFVGHENINPSKHLNCSGLHLNHLGTPILTANFLNVLNSLDSES